VAAITSHCRCNRANKTPINRIIFMICIKLFKYYQVTWTAIYFNSNRSFLLYFKREKDQRWRGACCSLPPPPPPLFLSPSLSHIHTHSLTLRHVNIICRFLELASFLLSMHPSVSSPRLIAWMGAQSGHPWSPLSLHPSHPHLEKKEEEQPLLLLLLLLM